MINGNLTKKVTIERAGQVIGNAWADVGRVQGNENICLGKVPEYLTVPVTLRGELQLGDVVLYAGRRLVVNEITNRSVPATVVCLEYLG